MLWEFGQSVPENMLNMIKLSHDDYSVKTAKPTLDIKMYNDSYIQQVTCYNGDEQVDTV